MFRSVCLCPVPTFQNIETQNKRRVKIMIATGGTVGFSKGITDDSCLVIYTYREENKLEFSWFVNTNEDVGDFRLELRTKGFPQTTLFEKDISYDTRYQVLNQVPGGEELNLCLLVKNSAGRVRRWRHDQCRKVGPFNSSWSSLRQAGLMHMILLMSISLLILVF